MDRFENTSHLTPWVCFISRLSTRFVGGEMNRMGFGSGHFFLIAALFSQDGLSQDELSRRVGVDKSITSRALARLEKDGLVRRENDPDNHRVKKVYLEPRAHEIRMQFRTIQRQWNADLLQGFSRREKAGLLAGLKKIAANAEAAFYGDG